MIALTGLTKSYRQQAVLKDLTLTVASGEIALLVGANGCGKTTTLRLIAGLSAADRGQIVIDGYDINREPSGALSRLSFLPQSPRFHPGLTGAQILDFYARLRGLPASRITAVVSQWGLGEYLRLTTARMSGGIRQRLGLAVFDLPDAPVLVLDEPGLSLDPDWRRTLQAHLHHAAARGRTVLVATHLLGEWEGHAHRCLVLDGGQVDREMSSEGLRAAFPFAYPNPALARLG
jgi:ABC-type multidrug transport system ATPase subunit